MARTESMVLQCHPDDEQELINAMQVFHWSLLSSQTIDRVDNRLEKRGEAIYNVRTAEKYVKLAFTRDLDLPNLGEIKKLEEAYNGLRRPERPKFGISPSDVLVIVLGSIPTGVVVGLLTNSYTFGLLGSIILILCLIVGYRFFDSLVEKERVPEYERNLQKFKEERRRILSEVAKYS